MWAASEAYGRRSMNAALILGSGQNYYFAMAKRIVVKSCDQIVIKGIL